MSCSPFDLRDYFLKELPDPEGRQVEAHVRACQPCREELERLRLTENALFSLRDEEIPQRIAFVSDKIFEPSPARRWWNAFWGSGARLGFAAAAILAIAIVVRPVGRVAYLPGPPAQPPATVVQTISDAEIQSRVDAAVTKAVAQVEARQTEQTKQLVADLEDTRKRLLLAAAEYDFSQKRSGTLRASAFSMPAEPEGAVR
ncbi:MAG TPA: zf-HC2 domain-containing protein [Bryobacteraceae bacterium]|nr:zf-HC2 domain-containing protein [Bryobacteraceae bacterium]